MKTTVGIALALWLMVVLSFGAAGAFSRPREVPPLPVLLGATIPLLVFGAACLGWGAFRAFILSADLRLVTAIQAWRTQPLGPEMGDYVLATTTESGPDGRPQEPGAINGGFFPKSEEESAQYPSVVIAVQDIREHMEKVNQAGGKVLGEPVEIPGVGWYVAFLDTEGNRVSMLQPSRS